MVKNDRQMPMMMLAARVVTVNHCRREEHGPEEVCCYFQSRQTIEKDVKFWHCGRIQAISPQHWWIEGLHCIYTTYTRQIKEEIIIQLNTNKALKLLILYVLPMYYSRLHSSHNIYSPLSFYEITLSFMTKHMHKHTCHISELSPLKLVSYCFWCPADHEGQIRTTVV